MTKIKSCKKISKNNSGGEALEVELDNGETVVFEDYDYAMQDINGEKRFIRRIKRELKDRENDTEEEAVEEKTNRVKEYLTEFKDLRL